MTKQDYIRISKAIVEARRQIAAHPELTSVGTAVELVISELCHQLAMDNQLFNENLFRKACNEPLKGVLR